MNPIWVSVAPAAPYFVLDDGSSWTPIGQNDALEWPELHGLFRRRDRITTQNYFRLLAESGVTVLRLMLEYCHHDHRYFERPAGRFSPAMLRLWDDIFALCHEWNLRILLTPFDTFWMWRRWKKHPYNSVNGGPCRRIDRFFLEPAVRDAVKARLDFVTARWGASGALFAWDLWNELHPAYGEDSIANATAFITDISAHLRATETRLYGRAHLQTVSTFLPLAQQRPQLSEAIYGHPTLDFATTHFYEEGIIDHPRDTVQSALSAGKLVRAALQEVPSGRPFFDSEHGPIHTFKDHRRTLKEPFDDEYFRHMQWAHLASGAAGGGMRWPNRKPHSLTPGMRAAQKSMAGFLPHVDWNRFQRKNWNAEVRILNAPEFAIFASGDDAQAVVWILRTRPLIQGRPDVNAKPVAVEILLPWHSGTVTALAWDTARGVLREQPVSIRQTGAGMVLETPPVVADLALTVRRSDSISSHR